MRFRIELRGDINLILPEGRMDGGRDCEELQTLIAELVASGCRKVAISFARTRWINSCGVGKLIAAKFHFDDSGGRLVLCDFNQRCLSVVNTLRLDEVFEIQESLSAAVEALKQDRACAAGSWNAAQVSPIS